MDARTLRCLTVAFSYIAAGITAEAATHQTVNFSVTAGSVEVAEQVGKAAEVYRQQLAIFWLGKPLPNWSRPCKINVNHGALGAGGQTTFQFVRGEVLNWRMEVQGSLERILDSVLPHEINHTIFACHFRRPLPRWADEGAATLFEHRSEQLKQLSLLNEVIRNRSEVISLRDLLAMKEYPRGQRPMLTLYAQGYALADFLVQQKGRHAYLKFISDGERGNWEDAIRTNFDHDGIESLERNWRGWVLAGMPKLTLPRDQMLAANEDLPELVSQETARPEILADPTARSPLAKPRRLPENATVRLQSPDQQAVKIRQTSATNSNGQPLRAARGDVQSEPATEGRESSFSAPVPISRSRHVGIAAGRNPGDPCSFIRTQQPAPDSEGLIRESSAIESRGDLLSDPAEDEDLSSMFESRRQLEQTGFAGSLTVAEPAGRFTGSSVELSGDLLPRERIGDSGSTPQWAGFPGQTKSF